MEGFRDDTVACVGVLVVAQLSFAEPVFPGAIGFGTDTQAGRGGQILRVTSLAGEGPGSLREAVETAGPRIVVFEIAGVIDLDKSTLSIREPFLTIAGQSAPSPGITPGSNSSTARKPRESRGHSPTKAGFRQRTH